MGKKLFNDAVSNGKINATDTIDLSKIEKETLRKKLQITKVNEKIISAMQLLNASNIEVKTYVTLLSLGCVDEAQLSKVMRIQETVIRNVLNTLKQREWVLKNNDAYIPVNPIQIARSEIYRLKKDFRKKIKKIKSEALVDLEALFVQNNFMRLQSKELLDLIL